MNGRLALVGAVLALAAPAARAQMQVEVMPEVRGDVIIGTPSAFQVGGGLTAPLGMYTRVGILGGVGFSGDGLSGRVDLIGRFHLDPMHRSTWGPYAGGGISTRLESGHDSRTYLLGFLGLEAPPSQGWTPAIELGFGGGVRIGVVLRRATAGER